MKSEGFFRSSNGKDELHYVIWAPEGSPHCTLQIIHGMSEYVERYEPLALYLTGFGIAVGGIDHLGHGKSSIPEDYGYFGEYGGLRHLMKDQGLMQDVLQERFPGVAKFMLGHSMGSFILRAYMATRGRDLTGVIIEGTSGKNPALPAGIALARLIKGLKGSKYRSRLLKNLSFNGYNKQITVRKTEYDWLTRREDIVKAYIEDPACGFTFTAAGYLDLFTLLRYIDSEECMNAYPKEVPVLIAAGSEDPVGAYGKGPEEVCERMRAAGCDARLMIYDGMRHELHNEIDKEEFYEDLLNFILSCVADAGEWE